MSEPKNWQGQPWNAEAWNQGKPWTDEMVHELKLRFYTGQQLEDMCWHFRRTGTAIVGKLQALGLLDAGLKPINPDQWVLLDEVRRCDRLLKQPKS